MMGDLETLKVVLNKYEIGNVLSIKNLKKGNTSSAYKITTAKGHWILRTLKDHYQGEIEYQISRHYHSNSHGQPIIPFIAVTKKGEIYVKNGNEVYNLQNFISGKALTGEINCQKSIGESAGLLHLSLNDFIAPFSQEDRFDLMTLWGKASRKWEEIYYFLQGRVPTLAEMEKTAKQLAIMTSVCTDYIHGDLGVWNMSAMGETIHIYDFGEARLGNRHFDIAAAIASSIRTLNENEIKIKVLHFLKGYESVFKPIRMTELLHFIQLWFLRGIFVLVNHRDDLKSDCKDLILYYHEAMNRFMKILSAL